ncbi:MAG TPA: AAA family ATPase [Opitutaceae bacterium]|nr:AAA family ATPase [Opitutaceae bacterium]
MSAPSEVSAIRAIPRVTLSSITFSGGRTIDLESDEVVLIVGANNAGKSATLAQILSRITADGQPTTVVTGLSLRKEGTVEELKGYLESEAKFQPGQQSRYRGFGWEVYSQAIDRDWSRENSLAQLAPVFVKILTSVERTTACNSTSSIDFTSNQPPSHPLHVLHVKDAIMKTASAAFKTAFGEPLMLHKGAGAALPLMVGVPPALQDPSVPPQFSSETLSMPKLANQGDGMRAFATVMISIIAGRESIVLLDEPEAFLHPPQARILAAKIQQDRRAKGQLFISTHSVDTVIGAVDSNDSSVRVIRLRRDGNINHATCLDNQEIKRLWGDPLLRHSNILDALFHERVVVCEADSDARFYSAMLDALHDEYGGEKLKPEVMFTHCGGKDRVPVVVRALKAIDVPVQVVVDFDVLSDAKTMMNITESVGIVWSDVSSQWATVNSAIVSKRPELAAEDVKEEIAKILNGIKTKQFPDESAKSIKKVLQKASPWEEAKKHGIGFVRGDQHQACKDLFGELKRFGLHILEIGEMESFDPACSEHGAKWVNHVLSARDLITDPDLEPAREFIVKLLGLPYMKKASEGRQPTPTSV